MDITRYIVAIHPSFELDITRYTRNSSVWTQTRNTLKKMTEKKQINRAYHTKFIAISWSKPGETDFLYLRPYVKNGNGEAVFDPSWLCLKCNHFYAANPECRHKLVKDKNRFVRPLFILRNKKESTRYSLGDPPQRNGLIAHKKSDTHKLACGIQGDDSEYTVFEQVYFNAYFGIAMMTHPFSLFLLNRHGVDTGKALFCPTNGNPGPHQAPIRRMWWSRFRGKSRPFVHHIE
eukprot:271062_1